MGVREGRKGEEGWGSRGARSPGPRVPPPGGGAQTLYQEGLEEPEQERSGLRMVF